MTAGMHVLVTIDITREIAKRAIVLAVGKHTLEIQYADGERDVINRLNAKAVQS